MEPDLIDERLRAARPPMPDAAPDEALLARLQRQPIARRRHPGARVAAVSVVAAALGAVVLLSGGTPNGTPSANAAISQALQWLDPAPGTVLHTENTESQDGRTKTHEFWQSGDDPTSSREVTGGQEISGEAVYDAATNTIYDPPSDGAKSSDDRPLGDPIVAKVRTILAEGNMDVTGPVQHNGVEAWQISLKTKFGRPVWTLWVSAEDGKPIELRDPGRDANEAPQTITWSTYEVLHHADANALTTLTGAHPTARIVAGRHPSQAEKPIHTK